MSLRNKIFLVFSGLTLIPLLIVALGAYQIFTTSKIDEVTMSAENSVAQLNSSFDLMIEDAAQSTLSLLYNNQLVNILRDYQDGHYTGYPGTRDINAFSSFLSGIVHNKEYIYGMHVMANNGYVFSHMGGSRVYNSIFLSNNEWYELAEEADGSWILFPEESPAYYRDDLVEYISFVRLLKDPANLQPIGVIKMDFSPEYMAALTDQLASDYWQVSVNGQPLFDHEENILLSQCEENRTRIYDEQGEEFFCVNHVSANTNIQISNAIPRDFIYSDIYDFIHLLILLVLCSLIITLLMSYYSSNYLLKPLERLKAEIMKYQFKRLKQNTPIDTSSSGIEPAEDESRSRSLRTDDYNEIGELSGAYDNLVKEINDLVGEIHELNIRNAESEYKALQSRMDPHFIFNALESINMTAINNNDLEVSDMTSELGQLIRYRLNTEKQMVKLYEEIDFTKVYINIMKQRMDEQLTVHWIVQQQVKGVDVPKYIIQPIIENSIQHGYKESAAVLNITVEVKEILGYLQIKILDDGAGMTQDTLMKVRERFEQYSVHHPESYHNSSIALVNIYRRLKLIYGQKSNMKVYSDQDAGTEVMYLIPV